ncbi:MAG: general secretion pathway protein GspA [Desulfobacteraceae bacterium]|nr:MAG: general secretion pathway protein GspA [Desulfobacteraceae bacterium]
MYEAFYGFTQKPFELNPDPAFHYMSSGHREAFLHLKYAILENKGFVVVTGEIGSGKTTLINVLLGKVGAVLTVGLINHTMVAPAEFLSMTCREFNLNVNGGGISESLELLHKYLLNQRIAGKRVTLIIDEAQNLSVETLEEVRMISNLETKKHRLIQIILVGQPELKNKLKNKGLIQLTQRVAVFYHLGALGKDEVNTYIHWRLKACGGRGISLFDPEAVEAIGRYSKGIPRVINILCDNALLVGFSDRAKTIDKKIVEDVIRVRESGEFFFSDSPASAPSPVRQHSQSADLSYTARTLGNRMQLMTGEMHGIKTALEKIEQHLCRIAEGGSHHIK